MSLNDIKIAKLAVLGYTGALNDAEMQFWLNYEPAPSVNTGVFNTAADGNTEVFKIAHGLGKIPVYANVTAGDAVASGTRYVTSDATYITVTYDLAPAAGTLTLDWVTLS